MNEDPNKELIERYKEHLQKHGLSNELYKWELLAKFQGRPNLDATDFQQELKSIDFSNLIYPVGIAVINHIATERTEGYRACFKKLFNEATPIEERISTFNEETLKIYRQLIPDKKLSHHQDERTMATFLTYRNPDKYVLYKSSFYKKYCSLLGIKSKKKNEKYIHYLALVNDFIEEYIKPDQELISLFQSILPAHAFQDSNFRVLAQDILYGCLEKQLGAKRKYWRVGTSANEKSYWSFMKSKGCVAIGWSEIGDLDEHDVESKKDVVPLLKSYYPKDARTASKKAREIFEFHNEISTGDIVVAQDGAKVLGVGIVTDEIHLSRCRRFISSTRSRLASN